MGKNQNGEDSDSYNGVAGFFAASSTQGIYQIYRDNISTPLEDWQKANTGYFNAGLTKRTLEKGIDNTWSEIHNA